MSAIPMKLEDALRFNGFTIDQADVAGSTIAVDNYGITGTIVLPPMRLSALTWRRPGDPAPSDSFYLEALPLFNADYQPILLSNILDRFANRRLSYDTPDDFGRAVRRWLNLNLGPMSTLNRAYASTAIELPMTTQDATTDRTTGEKSRDAHSDFPQGVLSGNQDYASNATDQVSAGTDNTQYEGRMGVSVMTLLAEQRASYLNVDAQVLDEMESLFLGLFDQDESERTDALSWPGTDYGYGALGIAPGYW